MPSSSLFLRSSTTLVSILSLLSVPTSAGSSGNYALDTEYSGSTFFDGFNFFNQADPTHGFVTYVDRETAENDQLIGFGGIGDATIKVNTTATYDNTKPYSNINGVGRQSVRIESQKSWTHGLIVADIFHMPGGICGTWPAFWTLGSAPWPSDGEVDIIEGSNADSHDTSSAHTGVECKISGYNQTGSLGADNCNYNDLGGGNGIGCGVSDSRTNSYGAGFNSNRGGVYAMEWTSEAIKIWFFPRGQVPLDLRSNSPDPSGWGTPTSYIGGSSCNVDNAFKDHRIVFDTTFCGDLGDATWGNSCKASTGVDTCAEYVAKNPNAFVDAYWDIGFVRVYQQQSNSTTPTSTATVSSTTTTTYTYNPTATNGTYTGINATYTGFPTGNVTTFTLSTATHPPSLGETNNNNNTNSFDDTNTATTYTNSFDGTGATATDNTDSPEGTEAVSVTSAGSGSPADWDEEADGTNDTYADDTDATGSWNDLATQQKDAPVAAYAADSEWSDDAAVDDSTTATASWEDWSSSTTTSTSSSDPTATWADWSSSSSSADPISTTSQSWEDWSSTTTPVEPASTTSQSWADWSSSDEPISTATSSWADWSSDSQANPTGTQTWADWSSTTDAADSTATGADSWNDWSSNSNSNNNNANKNANSNNNNNNNNNNANPASASQTWADWSNNNNAAANSAATPVAAASASKGSGPVVQGVTTMTVKPQPTSASPANANAWGSGSGSGNGSNTSPWVATYTGGASSTAVKMIDIIVVGIVGGVCIFL